jgi:hypothetical protein
MNDNDIFFAVVGTLAVISIIACVVLNNNRRIPHTASFEDDPAGATSDLLVLFSFLFTSLFLVTFMFEKVKINNCEKNIQQANGKVVEQPKECKDIKNKAP